MKAITRNGLKVLLALWAAWALGIAPGRVAAYNVGLPEDVAAGTEEQQTQWLNDHLAEGRVLQQRVARERHDQRMTAADQTVQVIANESFKRREAIQKAREALEARDQRVGRIYDFASILFLMLLVAAMGTGFIWYLRHLRHAPSP